MFENEELQEYKLTEEDIDNIKKIQREKYDKWEWNFGFSPKYNILKERRLKAAVK